MKTTKIITISLFLVVTFLTFSQGIPGPGDAGSSNGTSAPLDGGLLLALLAGGTFITGLIRKKKEKN